MVSADENGFIEYWQPTEPFELPKNVPGLWSFKSATDLYEFKKVSEHDLFAVMLTDCTLGEIDSDVHHALSRSQVLCHILPSRPANPCLLLLDRKTYAEI